MYYVPYRGVGIIFGSPHKRQQIMDGRHCVGGGSGGGGWRRMVPLDGWGNGRTWSPELSFTGVGSFNHKGKTQRIRPSLPIHIRVDLFHVQPFAHK